MVTEKQRKAREKFIKKYAGQKSGKGMGSSRKHFVSEHEWKQIKTKMALMQKEINRFQKTKRRKKKSK